MKKWKSPVYSLVAFFDFWVAIINFAIFLVGKWRYNLKTKWNIWFFYIYFDFFQPHFTSWPQKRSLQTNEQNIKKKKKSNLAGSMAGVVSFGFSFDATNVSSPIGSLRLELAPILKDTSQRFLLIFFGNFFQFTG